MEETDFEATMVGVMENLLELAVTSFIVGFTGAIMPGPVLIATILQSTDRGYMAGPLVTLGHALVELIITILLIFGLAFIANLPEVRVVFALIGGFILIYMGSEALKYSRKITMHGVAEKRSKSKLLEYGPISLGFLMSVSNPYWWIWWATVGNTFLLESLTIASIIGAVTFYFSHVMSDFTWYTLVSSSISKGRRIISNKVYMYILIVCGVFLVALGVIFIFDGVNLTLPYIK